MCVVFRVERDDVCEEVAGCQYTYHEMYQKRVDVGDWMGWFTGM